MYKIETDSGAWLYNPNLYKEINENKSYSIKKFFIGFFISIISVFILNIIIDITWRLDLFEIMVAGIISYILSTGIITGIIWASKNY